MIILTTFIAFFLSSVVSEATEGSKEETSSLLTENLAERRGRLHPQELKDTESELGIRNRRWPTPVQSRENTTTRGQEEEVKPKEEPDLPSLLISRVGDSINPNAKLGSPEQGAETKKSSNNRKLSDSFVGRMVSSPGRLRSKSKGGREDETIEENTEEESTDGGGGKILSCANSITGRLRGKSKNKGGNETDENTREESTDGDRTESGTDTPLNQKSPPRLRKKSKNNKTGGNAAERSASPTRFQQALAKYDNERRQKDSLAAVGHSASTPTGIGGRIRSLSGQEIEVTDELNADKEKKDRKENASLMERYGSPRWAFKRFSNADTEKSEDARQKALAKVKEKEEEKKKKEEEEKLKKEKKEAKKKGNGNANNSNADKKSWDDKPPLNMFFTEDDIKLAFSNSVCVSDDIGRDDHSKTSKKFSGFNALSRKNSDKILQRKKTQINLNSLKWDEAFPERGTQFQPANVLQSQSGNVGSYPYQLIQNSEHLEDFAGELFEREEEWRDRSCCGLPLERETCGYPLNKIFAYSTMAACTFLGLPTSSAVTGLELWSIGDILKIPVGGVGSGFLIGFTMATTTPALVRQMYERGRHIAEGVFTDEETEWLKSYCYEKSWIDYTMRGIVGVTASIEATVYLGAMVFAEKQFPVFIGLTGGSLFLAWLERYYDIGTRNIDRLLVKYWHDTKETQRKRRSLLDWVKESAQKTDSMKAAECDNLELMGSFFANGQEEDEEIDVTPLEHFLDHMSVLMTGWAATGRLAGSQYIIERIFAEYFSVNPDTASQIAWGFALYELLFKAGTEFQTQKEFFRGILDSFSISHYPDWPWARKLTGITTLASGGLLALIRVVPALENFNRWSSSLGDVMKYVAVAPSFCADWGYFATFLNEKSQNLITGLVQSLPERFTTESGIDWVIRHSEITQVQQWRKDITEGLTRRWNGETVDMLYERYGGGKPHADSNQGYQTMSSTIPNLNSYMIV